MTDIYEKKKKLERILLKSKSVAVAFSGGVDSTLLLKIAHDTLGDNAIAITSESALFPKREMSEAEEFCKKEGIKQIILKHDALSVEGFGENPENRCYICKKALFKTIKNAAYENGVFFIAEGSNADDLGDYRPGMKAVKELEVKSPLVEAGLSKAEIRRLSKELGLPTYDKPSFACLATRFEYRSPITQEGLKRVDLAEQYLIDKGIRQLRVRVHGDVARIETDSDGFAKFCSREFSRDVSRYIKSLGFLYVSLDLDGYKTGNMNKSI